MALGQVGARTEGDVYQGLFFWRQAADLLRPNSLVERVILEHDDADGVDDVAVFYRAPGVNAGGWQANADYFQLKYHVDNRNSYSADALIDPSFIKATASLLQRFHKAYARLSTGAHVPFRLHLASNWRWKDDDKLASLLREFDGELPPKFFEDGAKSDLGKVRENWRAHLGLNAEAFAAFARTLRFQLDHFGRREFKAYVYATLEAAGLRTPSADRAACPYESLVQQFLMSGQHSFDEVAFRALCEREGLLSDVGAKPSRPFALGVRSFMRFAERLESEVDELVCASSNFDGRHLAQDGSWEASAAQVLTFLGDQERRARLRAEESVIALECHGSFALLAGWELSRNSGAKVAPLQKPNLDVWRPTENAAAGPSWAEPQTIEKNTNADDVAICLSVTHDVRADVEKYLASASAPPVCRLVVLSPDGGPSPQSIKIPDHAYQLASALPALLTRARPSRGARAHVFFACPNALMFFIGQQREALGRLALYEFDFGIERDGSYQLSFSLPPTANAVAEHHEASHDP
jgi:SMODS-associated and fused to various effectors sensor domain